MKGMNILSRFSPEGRLIDTQINKEYLSSIDSLSEAAREEVYLEAVPKMCTYSHDLIFDFNNIKGVMPRCECAIGIREGKTKDIAIISRVGKPVKFIITDIFTDCGETIVMLSRRKVQEACIDEYIEHLQIGEIIDCRVTHLEQFGCFVDIGCGIASMIPIDAISISRISHPSDRFDIGDDVKAIVRGFDGEKVYLSHKELLGTWEENAEQFHPGETVNGVVRSIEPYGIFIELAPNLAGLAEPRPDVYVGQTASVYIKSINPDKMKIKLILVDTYDSEPSKSNKYFMTEGIVKRWRYSPIDCPKHIETVF